MSRPVTPEPIDTIDNPPGLGEVPYAHGRYASLRDAMLDVVARDTRYLRDLNSRDPADPTIALIDSWAIAGDVLSFYAERIANESWLPTASERRSLRSLARLIDYELRPGKAAEAWLAFTLESAPGAPLEVPISIGTRVQSIPGPDEVMVAFETVEDITARPHLSAMRPRMSRPQTLDDVTSTKSALCEGVLSDVRRGDWLLLAHHDKALLRVESAAPDAPANTTRLEFAIQPVTPVVWLPLLTAYYPIGYTLVGSKLTAGLISSEVKGKRRNQVALEAEFKAARIDPYELSRHLLVRRPIAIAPSTPEGLFHFQRRAAIFGHNEPNTVSGGNVVAPTQQTISAGSSSVLLDAEYAEVRPGGWVAFVRTVGDPFIATISAVDTVSARRGMLVGRVTRLTLGASFPSTWSGVGVETVSVLVDSRPLPLAPLPVTEDVIGSELRLDRYLPGLAEGRPIVVTGERADLPGVIESEVHQVEGVELDDGFTVLQLASAIAGPFLRGTVSVNGNVAFATHGETGGQPIGHGDASATGQTFRLPVAPLTHVGARTAQGLAAALEVRVDGILWREVPSLRDASPEDRVYQLHYGEDAAVWVRFGDGVNGRRLPTGLNNVVATWRKGLGREGMVRAGQLSLLSGAPQGVKGVLNPLPATGAADGETLQEARHNAPLSVLTLGRIVTLRDYEDFARAFAGIVKAQAVWSWNGTSRVIAMTVAGVAGDVPASQDIENLRTAIDEASDGSVALTIVPYRPASFRVSASLRVDPAHVPEVVLAAVAAALHRAFSFEERLLGQPVFRSEVIATMQGVPGVSWVDLDWFYRGEIAELAEALFAAAPRSGLRLGVGAAPVAAEVLTLHPGAPDLRLAT